MATARIQRLVENLLDRATAAVERTAWTEVAKLARAAHALDADNEDAKTLLSLAGLMQGTRPRTARDEQTGVVYVLRREDGKARFAAWFSALYLLAALGFFIWMLIDIWAGKNSLLVHLDFSQDTLASGTFRLLAFTAIAGALGGALDGIRSVISWHSERQAYGPAFVLKDLAGPWIGGTVAVFTYLALRSGVGVVSGDFSLNQTGSTPTLTAFAVGAIAGFSWHQVSKWLDAQGNRLFATVSATSVAAAFISDETATFTVGVEGAHAVTFTASPPVTLACAGMLPTGVVFDPDEGVLSGTPVAGSGGDYSLVFVAEGDGGPAAAQEFQLSVNETPAFTSPDHAEFTALVPGRFVVSAVGAPAPALSIEGSLPAGIVFASASGVFTGTPGENSAGSYRLSLVAANGVGEDVSQEFTLTVEAG